MTANGEVIKQIACGRRKPNMTRKEYFDYRFQIHGSISDAPKDPMEKPFKYIQTQISDAAFGKRRNGPLNANHQWFGRDDVTELFFKDVNHLKTTFASEYVKTKVGPDGPFFADFETTMVLLAQEKVLDLQTRASTERAANEDIHDNLVAMYFVSTPTNEREGNELSQAASPIMIEELNRYASQDAVGLNVNIGMLSSQFDLNSYFGGSDMPQFALVYKIFMRSVSSVAAIRKAQKAFETRLADKVDAPESFIVFGKEALVLDVDRDIQASLRP